MKEKILIWKILGTPNKFTNTYRNPYQRLFLKFTQKKKKVYSLRILKMLSIQYWVHIHTYVHFPLKQNECTCLIILNNLIKSKMRFLMCLPQESPSPNS